MYTDTYIDTHESYKPAAVDAYAQENTRRDAHKPIQASMIFFLRGRQEKLESSGVANCCMDVVSQIIRDILPISDIH